MHSRLTIQKESSSNDIRAQARWIPLLHSVSEAKLAVNTISSAQSSSRVEESRSLVAFDILLIFAEALVLSITKTSTPCPILTLQHEVHEQRATHQEQKLVAQHHTMAGIVPRPLALDEDVR